MANIADLLRLFLKKLFQRGRRNILRDLLDKEVDKGPTPMNLLDLAVTVSDDIFKVEAEKLVSRPPDLVAAAAAFGG